METFYKHIMPVGVTLGFQYDDFLDQYHVTFAICSEKDNYCRKTGRDMVNQRFGDGISWITPKVPGLSMVGHALAAIRHAQNHGEDHMGVSKPILDKIRERVWFGWEFEREPCHN